MADSGICSLGTEGTFSNDGEGSFVLVLGLLPLSEGFWLLLSTDMMLRDFEIIANSIKNLITGKARQSG